jgi:hypothetical protein
MDPLGEVGQSYQAAERFGASHLALGWKGRMRYAVPSDARAQMACWQLFQPGRMELPLRLMARLPRLFGAVSCVEGKGLALIREAIGAQAGVSCCRAGAPGPWSKETILFLDAAQEPICIVKAGAGESVNQLLQNEAVWLRRLSDQPALAVHVPALVAHRAGSDLSFVAQSVLPGPTNFALGEPHFAFLLKFQQATRQSIRYQDSHLYQNLHSRLRELDGMLTGAWTARINKAMQLLEESFNSRATPMVAAHNDFTPWNIRVQGGMARIFDWEYACDEQLPLFDPLHFALMPMVLARQPRHKLALRMQRTMQLCEERFDPQLTGNAPAQALAYLMNLCTLYLWGARHNPAPNSVLEGYAGLIDEFNSGCGFAGIR